MDNVAFTEFSIGDGKCFSELLLDGMRRSGLWARWILTHSLALYITVVLLVLVYTVHCVQYSRKYIYGYFNMYSYRLFLL